MGKTKNTSSADRDKIPATKLNKQENKPYKKIRMKDFIKSPSSQQCNKISTWLNRDHKKSPSCPIQQRSISDEEVKVLYMKGDQKKQEKPRDKPKKRKNQDVTYNSEHNTNQQKVNVEKEKVIIKPFTNKYEKLVKKPRGLQSSKSLPIPASKNVTPTKEKHENEPEPLRRSPRTSNKSPPIPSIVKTIIKEQHEGEFSRQKSSKSPSGSVARKLFTDREIPANSALHMWLANHDKRKNFKPEMSIENSPDKANFKIDLLKVEDLPLKMKRKRSRSDERKKKRRREKYDKSNSKQNQEKKEEVKSESKENIKKEKLLNTWLGKREEKGDKTRPPSSRSSSRNEICPESDKIRGKDYKNKSQIEKEPLRKKQKLNSECIKNKNKDGRIKPQKSNTKKYVEGDNTVKITRNKENLTNEKKKIAQKPDNKNSKRTDNKKQNKLDGFVGKKSKDKASKKSKLSRNSSSESSEFPSFGSTEKSSTSESFKKYGLVLPTTESMLKEQEDLKKYRSEIETFQDIEIDTFNLPFSVKDLNKPDANSIPILDCKHLTMDEISEHFKKNLPYISDIFFGKTYNERHEKFFSKKYKNYKLQMADLMCSSSVVVFTYDQKEHIINMLRETFDSEDEWTPYFFQILLPELCLKIFMDVHNMSQEEAVKYLDVMPIIND